MRSYGRFLVHARYLRAARGLLADLAAWVRFASLTALVAGLQFNGWWDPLTGWFSRIPGDVLGFVTDAINAVKDWAWHLVDDAKAWLQTITSGLAFGMKFITGVVTDVYNFAKGYVEQAIRDLQGWAHWAFDGIIGAVSAFAHSAYDAVMGLLQPLIDKVTGLAGWIYNTFIAPVINELRSLGDWIYHHMIVPAINDIVKWTTLLFGPVVEWYRQVFGVVQWLIDHGIDALRWLVNHIPIFEEIAKDPVGWVERKLADVARKGSTVMRDAFLSVLHDNGNAIEDYVVKWLG